MAREKEAGVLRPEAVREGQGAAESVAHTHAVERRGEDLRDRLELDDRALQHTERDGQDRLRRFVGKAFRGLDQNFAAAPLNLLNVRAIGDLSARLQKLA